MLKKWFASCLAATALVSAPYTLADNVYEVTVTNLTYGQVLTPPIAVVHKRGHRVFEAGGVASPGLKTLAETGSPALLGEESENTRGVRGVFIGDGVVPPGQSLTLKIKAKRRDRVSVLGMLATTNDGFFAASSVPVLYPNAVNASVYDAGTEANTERCDDLPGPPCGGASNNEVVDGAEGFIHIHRGFHGVNEGDGDSGSPTGQALADEDLDWRGPAARISIRRTY